MAGKSEEEEYLDRLLQNVIDQDARLSEEDDITDDNSIGKDSYQPELDNFDLLGDSDDESSDSLEKSMLLDELLSDMQTEADDYYSDGDTVESETAGTLEETDLTSDDSLISNDSEETDIFESDYLNNLKDIVEKSSEESVLSDAIEALSKESILTDESSAEAPEENTDLNSEDNQDLAFDESMLDEFNDILALDDGVSFDDIPQENEEEPLSEAEMLKISAMESDNIAEGQTDRSPDDKSAEGKKTSKTKKDKAPKNKKGKKEKPVKDKSKKKFSIKNFFLDYDEDENSTDDADMNQQLIDELYTNKDSLAETDIENTDKKPPKEKKEKKPKEKKDKPKKEKAPKKEKTPKAKAPKGKIDIGAIFKAVIIAAVIVAIIIISCNVFTYRNSISKARSEFEMGHYEAAGDILSGMNVKSKDDDLYMKVRTVASIYQGISSYENYISLGMQTEALDALINAVGRKNKNENLIDKYQITSEVNGIYSRILELLDSYGISEKEALDYYNMTSLEQYRDILESYGGPVDDSNN